MAASSPINNLYKTQALAIPGIKQRAKRVANRP
jgi:hypothetical protein